MEPLYIVGVNIKCYSHFVKQFNSALVCKTEFWYDEEILLLGIYPRELKAYVHTKTCIAMFIVAEFVTAKKWKKTQMSVN